MIKDGEKVGIFIISKGLYMINYYNFDKLMSLDDFRLIAIVNHEIYEEFRKNNSQYFSKIYTVNKNHDTNNECLMDESGIDAVLTRELQECNDRSSIRIFAHNEFNVTLAAKLREKHKIPGLTTKNSQLFRDKVVMKTFLHNAGIRVPKFTNLDFDFMRIDAHRYYNYLVHHVGSPFIIKPTNAAGAMNVKKICSLDDFELFRQSSFSLIQSYEAEEFINGRLFHCDTVLKNNVPMLSYCSEYNHLFMQFIEGKCIGSIPLLSSNPLNSKINNFVAKILSILQPGNAVTHTEIFYIEEKNEFVFLETAARAGGTLIIPMYENTFGVNLLDLSFAAVMDIPYPETKLNYHNKYCFWAYVPWQEGIVKKLYEPSLVSKYNLEWFIKIGDKTSKAAKFANKSAQIFAWNHDYNVLKNDFNLLDSCKFIDVTQE